MSVSRLVELSDQNKFLGMIGHVCLQWALLELNLLALLSALENIPSERAEIIFGGLDMQPRCNMAINLARHHRVPGPMVKRMEAIRKSLQNGIADRRNQAVHGAHAESDFPQHVRLRMVRWKGDRSVQHVSISDMYNLAMEIATLATEAGQIFDDYGTWKFGNQLPESVSDDPAENDPRTGYKFAQDLRARISLLWDWIASKRR